jgi:hypothetical protein
VSADHRLRCPRCGGWAGLRHLRTFRLPTRQPIARPSQFPVSQVISMAPGQRPATASALRQHWAGLAAAGARRQIVRAAWRLFVASGYAETTVEQMVAEGQVSVATVHQAFATKAAHRATVS